MEHVIKIEEKTRKPLHVFFFKYVTAHCEKIGQQPSLINTFCMVAPKKTGDAYPRKSPLFLWFMQTEPK